jgi:HEAT repeat protein
MNGKTLLLLVVVLGAVGALLFAMQPVPDADSSPRKNQDKVSTEQNPATVIPNAGESRRVQALEAEITELRRERDGKSAEVKRLQARVAVLAGQIEKKATQMEFRPTADVLADVSALTKTQGVKTLSLSKDNPLFKELAAMGPEGIKLLGTLLETGDQNQRFGAAALMAKLMDGEAIPHLNKAIFAGGNDDNVLVQRMASSALGSIGGETAVPVLERILDHDLDWGVQTNAAASLAQMGRKDGIDWIRENYHSQTDSTAKLSLLAVMSQVGDPSYLPDLHKALQEETEYSKRYLAVSGIAKAARDESLPILEGIMNNPEEDKMIISEAKKAYEEIKGDAE